MQILLEADGYQTQLAKDGADALQQITSSKAPIDAMVLDLRMPTMTGIGLLEELAAQNHPAPPAILCSAYLDPYTAIKAARLGVVDFLRKPVTPTDLRNVISSLIKEEELSQNMETAFSALPFQTCSRILLRRGDHQGIITMYNNCSQEERLKQSKSIWLLLAYHFQALDKQPEQVDSLSSINFYNALDVLDFLASN